MEAIRTLTSHAAPLPLPNIDTDQIIPAQYLTLVPTIAEEYEKLGSYAMIGLPDDQFPAKFVPEGQLKTPYRIVIAGRNFGCGSSREHAAWAINQYGFRAVIAPTFADIFFSNAGKNGIILARLTDRHGAERAERIAKKSRNLLIFPNLVIVDVMSLTLRTFFPRTPEYMEVTAWSIGPSEETPWLRKNRLNQFLEFLGPGGFATPDDVEMLENCQRGYRNAKEAGWNDVSRGMLNPQPATVDEHQIRVFWRRWQERLDGAPRRVALKAA